MPSLNLEKVDSFQKRLEQYQGQLISESKGCWASLFGTQSLKQTKIQHLTSLSIITARWLTFENACRSDKSATDSTSLVGSGVDTTQSVNVFTEAQKLPELLKAVIELKNFENHPEFNTAVQGRSSRFKVLYSELRAGILASLESVSPAKIREELTKPSYSKEQKAIIASFVSPSKTTATESTPLLSSPTAV